MERQQAPAPVRLDIWLWAARFYKTRALAKQAIEGGKVEVEGQGPKASRMLKTGEQLRVRRGEVRSRRAWLELKAIVGTSGAGPVRGVCSLARTAAAPGGGTKGGNAGYRPPTGKPDKRARRLIQALGDLDAL